LGPPGSRPGGQGVVGRAHEGDEERQVRRAISRSARASSAEGDAGPAARDGRLIQRSSAGDTTQSSRSGSATGDEAGQTPEVLDEHDAQDDRDGPELADGQGLHALVAAHEAADVSGSNRLSVWATNAQAMP